MSKTKLFDEFSPVSAKEWKQKIQVDLKGADYNNSLVWESLEGIKVKPFYHQDEVSRSAKIHKASAAWQIVQPIYAGDAQKANLKIKSYLKKGAEGLYISFPSDAIAVEVLLDGIDISKTKIHCHFEFLSIDFIKKIIGFSGDNQKNIYLNIDLIGNLTKTGNWFENLEKDHQQFDTILDLGATNVCSVDLSQYQNAGANTVQQLAYSLAHANEYLNHIDEKGKISQFSTINFHSAQGSNYFFEIAKLRALRVLWRSLAVAYGVNANCHITALPSKRNKTLYDYNTNMLRTTTESMSAVLGGADAVMNMPYDAIYHKTNEFGDRIAINQLLLLKNESYFDKVQNPADGAYYIEALTEQLSEKALSLFKEIEKSGGFLHQLKNGTIQRKISESAQKEQTLFDEQQLVLVGTNKFQNEKDKMKDTLELYPFLKTNTRKTFIQPILEKRLAEVVEQKRLNDE